MKLLRTAGALLFAGLSTAACTGADVPPTPGPSSAPSVTTPAAPTATPTPSRPPLSADGVDADGLTIRYQAADGRIETLRVEDFRR